MPATSIRLDKWLWFARFFRTRSLAARVIGEHGIRVNGARVSKPAFCVRAGDLLTFSQGRTVRVVEILACGERRGPAAEAQSLYTDRSPPPQVGNPRFDEGGRPTKKRRRELGHLADKGRLGD